MKVTLTVIAGPHLGREFSFEEHTSFIAGRSRKAQFRLPQKDQYFSRMHFLIELNPPLCRIIDLESLNGTDVNGQRINSVTLTDGDLIEAGETVLRVDIVPSPGQVQTTSSLPLDEPSALEQTLDESHNLSPAVMNSIDLLPPDYRERISSHVQPFTGYSIVDELGSGGMGVVYRAICEADQSVVALKTLRPAVAVSNVEFEKFRREAMILRDLNHPRIVRFRDVGESSGIVYFAMEYVPGIDGQKLMRQLDRPLPVGRAVGIIVQLLQALEYAHGQGYVHRDIKPSNLLVHQVAGRDCVWLTDFGLARTYQASRISGLTMTGDIGGTTPFMPPEQILSFRESPPAVDQYAAAATLYKLLTNTNVYDFPKEVPRQLLMILTDPTVPIDQRRSDLPPDLVDAIHRALSREPEERFLNVKAFQQAIEGFAV